MKDNSQLGFECPLPITRHTKVLMGHGGGGRLMRTLIDGMLRPALTDEEFDRGHDGAILEVESGRLAFTTDSFVIQPLFFPGGNIGRLAVFGTANDLAMCGARPLWMSAGLILEEGLLMEDLWKVVRSMGEASTEAGVRFVTGDTKVVDRGKGDGIFINTSGIGRVPPGIDIHPARVRPGDVCLVSGDLGRHGIAVMNARESLQLESAIESDLACLVDPVFRLIDGGVDVHCLRDLTRGGLASALIEIAEAAELQIHLEEARIPVRDDVHGACELLGLDPVYVANEGRFVCFVPEEQGEAALGLLQQSDLGQAACLIGHVEQGEGRVTIESRIGVDRILDMLSGEQLPRIC